MTPHLLFVDDDTQLSGLLALYFEAHDFVITTAATPAEARESLEKAQFDLAILDVNLNGESGLDLLDYVKSKHPTLPVLMFTGLDVDEDLVKKTLRGRGEGIIHKTQSLAGLLTAVRWHLARASAQ